MYIPFLYIYIHDPRAAPHQIVCRSAHTPEQDHTTLARVHIYDMRAQGATSPIRRGRLSHPRIPAHTARLFARAVALVARREPTPPPWMRADGVRCCGQQINMVMMIMMTIIRTTHRRSERARALARFICSTPHCVRVRRCAFARRRHISENACLSDDHLMPRPLNEYRQWRRASIERLVVRGHVS